MKRISIMSLAVLLLLSTTALFARGGAEEVIDEVVGFEGQTIDGVTDIDYSGWELGRSGGKLVLTTPSDPISFNYIVAADTTTTVFTRQLSTAAIRRSQLDLEYEPALAESWSISPDEKTITVTIKRGLKYSDGTPITSHDFVFGLNQLILREDIGSNSRSGNFIAPAAGEAEEPVEAKIINAYSYSVTLPTVYADLVGVGALDPLPRHIFGPVIGWDESVGYDYDWEWGEDENGNKIVVEIKPEGIDYAAITSFWGVDTDVTKIVSSGPFVISEYLPSERVVLARNPFYYEKDAAGMQLPYLDEVVRIVSPDTDTNLQKFLSGETDAFGMRGTDYATLVGRQDELNYTIYNAGPDGGTFFLTFNMNPIEGDDDIGLAEPMVTWLNQTEFRRAVAHCIDRQTIIDVISSGLAIPQYVFLPFQSPYFDASVEQYAPHYDLAKARELLDSIDYIDRDGDGWREDPNGNKIELSLISHVEGTTATKMLEIIGPDLRSIGLDVETKTVAFSEMVGQLMGTYDWEMLMIGLTGSIEPIGGSNVYPSSGNLHMGEPYQVTPRRDWEREVDDLWVYANNTTDQEQRKDGYRQMTQIWAEEVPWAFTRASLTLTSIKNHLGNVIHHPFNPYNLSSSMHRIFVR